MALSNAEKQARWRERNVVALTDRAEDIAWKLIEMDDQDKLRKIAKFIDDHLKQANPEKARQCSEPGASLAVIKSRGAWPGPL